MSESPPPISKSPSYQRSPSPVISPPTAFPIHTYHCLCSTLLLATPYLLTSLPTRAREAKDQAHILPLPPFRNNSDQGDDGGEDDRTDGPETANAGVDALSAEKPTARRNSGVEAGIPAAPRTEPRYLPSLLLPSLRPARKSTLVERDDGYERRRVWRCGRCGLTIGYEVENTESAKIKDGGGEDDRVRVMYILKDGLMPTESMLSAAPAGGAGKSGSATELSRE
ncbi:hypothetical protein MMC07_006751 [Pseudocyphellaria aurata]|nr:hypothetical protein [Pseudocyphellaria aurata]